MLAVGVGASSTRPSSSAAPSANRPCGLLSRTAARRRTGRGARGPGDGRYDPRAPLHPVRAAARATAAQAYCAPTSGPRAALGVQDLGASSAPRPALRSHSSASGTCSCSMCHHRLVVGGRRRLSSDGRHSSSSVDASIESCRQDLGPRLPTGHGQFGLHVRYRRARSPILEGRTGKMRAKAERPTHRGGRGARGGAGDQMGRTWSACGPRWPCVTSNSTRWFSSSER